MNDMLEVLGDLRNITATRDRGCTRLAYTQFEQQAHDYVWDWLRDIPGLQRIEDAAGNTFIGPARAASANEPMVLIGSHLDTVIEGGWLDGALGIAAGMHVLREQGNSQGVGSDWRQSSPGIVDAGGLPVFRPLPASVEEGEPARARCQGRPDSA